MSASIYKTYDADQVDNLLSNFLISSWSYSKVSQFSRHEKAFEMGYIYNIRGRSAASSVAGNAYHFALDRFFNAKKRGDNLDIVTLESIAYEYIEDFPVQFWKCQITTPTVQDCKIKAIKNTNALLKNFFSEIGVYVNQIKEVIEVEVYCDEWLTINGVDIPMPCHMKIDLVFLSIEDKIVIADHKSKTSFTGEVEAKLSIGEQAITYVCGYESKSGLNVDEVWFIENKISENKDKTSQLLPIKIKMDDNTRRLYESMLYSPLKRMLSAVNDPDHDYIINWSDSYADKAEIAEFWAKTMIAEVEDFPIDPKKKSLIEKRLKKVRDVTRATINPKVIRDFQKNAAQFIQYDLSNKDMTQQEKIEHILSRFNLIVRVAFSFDGYSSNTYLLEVSAGIKVASIHSHKLDIANALDVSAVRISSDLVVYKAPDAPADEKPRSYLAVEFSKQRERDLMFDPSLLVGVKIPLGMDNFGNVLIWDFNNQATPFFLTCGAAGSGKSVLLRSTIEYSMMAGLEQIDIYDPKFEFIDYENRSKRVRVFNEILTIEEKIQLEVEFMNTLIKTGKKKLRLLVFDEFADAVAQSRKGPELDIKEMVQVGNYKDGSPKMQLQRVGELKSLEENLRILLQKGRSTGLRIMAATQRASVKIMSGDLKVNFSGQICLRVPKEVDSNVVLGEGGGESLAGHGDFLIKSPEYRDTVRGQAFFTPTECVEVIE